RTYSTEALAPVNSCTASIIIDFPAPVSPVIIVNHSSNVTDKSSIIAKFRIVNSVNKIIFSFLAVHDYIISKKLSLIDSASYFFLQNIKKVSLQQIFV